MSSLSVTHDRARRAFRARFGAEPRWSAAAPGRVNLIGEHTDYNGGFVLPMAIDCYTVAAAGPGSGRRIRLFSENTGRADELDAAAPITRGGEEWAHYVRGVLAGFQRLGAEMPGLDVLIDSDVPLGSGLSSSAALEVAVATLLESVTGQVLDPVQKALLCQRAEHEFAGVPCGLMDQLASTLAREGHLLLLDCRSQHPEHVPMTDPAVSVLITNSGVRHALATGEYGERRARCEEAAVALGVPLLRDATLEGLEAAKARMPDVTFRRARHVVIEDARTVQAAQLLRQGRWSAVGELMYQSHASLRDDFEVSCPELDQLVEISRALGEAGGVYGCRMTGGGFGGCTVSLVATAAVEAITAAVRSAYREATDIDAAIFTSRPAQGAAILSPARPAERSAERPAEHA
ncbi:MAG TPA: galactokinase [Kofleriaceae bacterium]|nr:galactokinase [Kofleriaceae bacterium]